MKRLPQEVLDTLYRPLTRVPTRYSWRYTGSRRCGWPMCVRCTGLVCASRLKIHLTADSHARPLNHLVMGHRGFPEVTTAIFDALCAMTIHGCIHRARSVPGCQETAAMCRLMVRSFQLRRQAPMLRELRATANTRHWSLVQSNLLSAAARE